MAVLVEMVGSESGHATERRLEADDAGMRIEPPMSDPVANDA
jgi:hypothetical protein